MKWAFSTRGNATFTNLLFHMCRDLFMLKEKVLCTKPLFTGLLNAVTFCSALWKLTVDAVKKNAFLQEFWVSLTGYYWIIWCIFDLWNTADCSCSWATKLDDYCLRHYSKESGLDQWFLLYWFCLSARLPGKGDSLIC